MFLNVSGIKHKAYGRICRRRGDLTATGIMRYAVVNSEIEDLDFWIFFKNNVFISSKQDTSISYLIFDVGLGNTKAIQEDKGV